MPWVIKKQDNQFCVHKKTDGGVGEKVACHDTEEQAKRHMRALYANMPMSEKSIEPDSLVFSGGAVKSLGNGKVGGYLAVFSGPNDPDLQGDFFTKSTDFFIDNGDQRPILYRHGLNSKVKSMRLGKAQLTIDEQGVWAEGELQDFYSEEKGIRQKYLQYIQRLADEGQLGWSSGSMAHLVQKKQVGKSFEILTWPIGEASLTPIPVEGRTSAIPLKEFALDQEIDFDAVIKSLDKPVDGEEELVAVNMDGIPSIKAFCEAVSPTSQQDGSQRSKAAVDATKEFITIGKVLGEGFHSYASRLVRRTENRFLKEGREIHPATIEQVGQLLGEMDRMEPAFQSVKEALLGIKRIADMTVAEQKALDERARLAMWNFCRISGTTPEELENGRTASS